MKQFSFVVATILLGSISGCGGGATKTVASAPQETAQPPSVRVSLEAPPATGDDENTDVTLVVTERIGKTERIELGAFPAPCKKAMSKPAPAMKTLDGINCGVRGSAWTWLRLVHRDGHIFVLRANVDASADPGIFEIHRKIPIPFLSVAGPEN